MTAHHSEYAGLRSHSVGVVYPLIRVTYGDKSRGLILGGHELRGLSRSEQGWIGRHICWRLSERGWTSAMLGFKQFGAVPIRNH